MIEQNIVRAARPLRFKGKHRLLGLITPQSGMRSARIFGARFDLDLSDWIQRSIYFGTLERDETRIVRRYLKPGMTVLDVGANVGYYTALAAFSVGNTGSVYAIEPSPREFIRLQRLISDNSLNARAFNFGLDEKVGTQSLYEIPGSSNRAPTMVEHGGYPPIATIPVRRLDDLIEEWGLHKIDLLKIDVEGWEPRVFAGARRALSCGQIRAILCEFNEVWLRATGSSARALWQMLADFGYKPIQQVSAERLLASGLATCFLTQTRNQS